MKITTNKQRITVDLGLLGEYQIDCKNPDAAKSLSVTVNSDMHKNRTLKGKIEYLTKHGFKKA